jgi:hypothetical protein
MKDFSHFQKLDYFLISNMFMPISSEKDFETR